MSDMTLLYWGVFCFALTLLGLALTIFEFRKMSRSPASQKPMRSPPLTASRSD
ncbi:MAG: hypothetical protein IPJ21_06990 [Sterolibacteriaceae bacterium]|jgi:hypothetical protein|nr:hypothetical protein [Sterolibacteriaceae bacterium]MBK9087383.1 hypothetical protein [Sterolibacteriaceae bacterium]